MLASEGIPLDQAIEKLIGFLGEDCIIGHYVAFDIQFLHSACEKLGLQKPTFQAIDTVALSRAALFGTVANFRLETLIKHFGIAERQSHRALPDALVTAQLYLKLNENL